MVSDTIRNVLGACGHTVGTVGDGTTVLQAIGAKNPDLVILDCNMPGISGISALREIRNSKKFYDLPVIMLTSRTGDIDVRIAMTEGANDYIRKPFDPEELAFRVDEVLKKAVHYPLSG